MKANGKDRQLRALAYWVLLLVLALPGGVYAAQGIGVEYLGRMNVEQSVLWGPGRLAVGGDGTLFVTDGYKNHVLKFDRNGAYQGDIRMPRVSAVAVAPDGTLYVGSHRDYTVAIFKDNKVAGYLGAGAHEFSSITDIAVDADTGNVYVADSVGSVVKVYSASGKRMGGIKEQLHLPMGVAVAGNEVYILNAPGAQDGQSGEKTTASEVAVYDKTGKFVRKFGDSGPGEYQMARPTGIAVAGGLVYVSDAARNAVLVFDPSGACLGEIQGKKGETDIAVSVALSQDGVLYVSTNESQSIRTFAIRGAGAGPGALRN